MITLPKISHLHLSRHIPEDVRVDVVTIFGYGVKPSETNKPRMCNIAHALANKPKA